MLIEGKVSKKGRVFKTWRDRHLVLYSNGDLCYYKSENKSVRKGYLKLTHHADVQKAKRSGKFYFIVFTNIFNFLRSEQKDVNKSDAILIARFYHETRFTEEN